MFKVKNIILSLALLGCSGLAQAQQVEQRIDSLQILIGQQTVLHLKASVKQGDKVDLPSFKPQQQLTPGVEVVEQSKGDTSHIGDDRMVVSRDYTLTSCTQCEGERQELSWQPACAEGAHRACRYGSSQPVLSAQGCSGQSFLLERMECDFLVEPIAVNPLWRMALSAQQTEKQQADYHPYPHRKTCSGS